MRVTLSPLFPSPTQVMLAWRDCSCPLRFLAPFLITCPSSVLLCCLAVLRAPEEKASPVRLLPCWIVFRVLPVWQVAFWMDTPLIDVRSCSDQVSGEMQISFQRSFRDNCIGCQRVGPCLDSKKMIPLGGASGSCRIVGSVGSGHYL